MGHVWIYQKTLRNNLSEKKKLSLFCIVFFYFFLAIDWAVFSSLFSHQFFFLFKLVCIFFIYEFNIRTECIQFFTINSMVYLYRQIIIEMRVSDFSMFLFFLVIQHLQIACACVTLFILYYFSFPCSLTARNHRPFFSSITNSIDIYLF